MQTAILKAELLEILIKNREQHEKAYEEAWIGYVKKVQEQGDEASAWAGDKKRKGYSWPYLPVPTSHKDDYDRVIKMVERTADTKVYLSEKDYAQFIEDDWDWKAQFVATTSTYR